MKLMKISRISLKGIWQSVHIKKIRKWIVHYFGGLYNKIDDHHIFLLAGGLAFSIFVCIVPLVLIVFAVLGRILEVPAITDDINAFIDRAIPYSDYADFVKQIVFTRIEEFRVLKNLAGLIGFVGLFFASSGLFSSMRTILNMVYRVRSRGSAIIGKLRDFGLIILVLFYFLLSTAVLPAVEIIEEFAGNFAPLQKFKLDFTGDILLNLLSFLIILGAFAIIYWLVPHTRLPKKVIFLSAFCAAILWSIAKYLFGMYIANVFTLKRIYGAYALMVITAFWVYYTSIVFIVGAEIGQLYRERIKTPQQTF